MPEPVVLQQKYVLGDVVCALLTKGNLEAFTGDTAKIHKTFHAMRTDFPLLQRTMVFSDREVFPFSRELEEALLKLELSRIIGMENPDYDRYIVKSAGREFVEKYIVPLFSEEELRQIQEMASVFAEECGAKPQPR